GRVVGEVLVEPLPQRLRLAHVDDPAALVAEPVHARLLGDLPGLGAITIRVGHGIKTSRRRLPAVLDTRPRRADTEYPERVRAARSRSGPLLGGTARASGQLLMISLTFFAQVRTAG